MDNNISPRDILKFLAIGGVLIAAIAAPNAVQAFSFLLKDKNYINRDNFKDFRVRQTVNRLKRRGLIKKHVKNRKLVVILTKKGKEEILKYDFNEIKLPKQRSWDGKWRVVIFDIPEFQKAARDALRRKFKSLGMYQLQKSVFVYPYDCKKEIDFISGFYDVGDYIFYLESTIDDIGGELKRIFNIN